VLGEIMETKKIVLKHGEIALVDADDYDRLFNFNWYSVSSKGSKYAKTGKNTRMHRMILNLTDSKLIVDHLNGNGLDNRKQNLRIVSSAENVKNRQRPSSNKKSIPGVYKQRDKWIARVCVNYENISLGRFEKEEDAVIAVNKFRLSVGRPVVTLTI
jgi:hypothetical protein